MAVTQSAAVVWVVTDADAGVVIMCSGADAPEFVAEWQERGYHAAMDAAKVRAA